MTAASAYPDPGPAELVAAARRVQSLPYCWPGPPDAEGTGALGAGTCAGKHALLAEVVERELGLICGHLLVVGPLVPELWPDLAGHGAGIVEVHECLTVLTPWAGPLIVDVTWHPSAVAGGLPGLAPDWDGRTDVPCAVASSTPGYSVAWSGLRDQKLALRDRLYTPVQRSRREELLALIADRAARL